MTAIQELAQELMAGDTAEAAVGERINRLAMNFDFEGLGRARRLAGDVIEHAATAVSRTDRLP